MINGCKAGMKPFLKGMDSSIGDDCLSSNLRLFGKIIYQTQMTEFPSYLINANTEESISCGFKAGYDWELSLLEGELRAFTSHWASSIFRGSPVHQVIQFEILL